MTHRIVHLLKEQPHPVPVANTLAQLAIALAQAGDASSVARAAAALCTFARWTTAATAVLQLAPSAFTALADRWKS
jgi:hypothetical protein